jgi:hypothetical protein
MRFAAGSACFLTGAKYRKNDGNLLHKVVDLPPDCTVLTTWRVLLVLEHVLYVNRAVGRPRINITPL